MSNFFNRLRNSPHFFGTSALAAAVLTSMIVAWGVQPDSTTADDFANHMGPPDLGTLVGQQLSMRVIPGPGGPGYEILDAEGVPVGRFQNQFEMIAAFDVPRPSSQLAEVATYDPYD
ncbi:MAG: hypothetical protein CMJ52_04215 [Planctomycetaceae bacterium]|nr:hypothetical protein [Planctomycetaceae bacterium]